MFSIFLWFNICSVTKESHNSGLGLIADDHNTAGRSGPENLAESCELAKVWRRVELLHELFGVCRSNAMLDLMPHFSFLVFSGRGSLCTEVQKLGLG